ncbi:Filamentous hemagglutinin family outer membrane protein [Gammaproteobacteria bacterium]
MKLLKWLIFWLLGVISFSSAAFGPPPMMRPPAFAAGIPGMAQMHAIVMQRHQARTLLYREALEELHKNPTAADVPECTSPTSSSESLCLRQPETPPTESTTESEPQPVTSTTPIVRHYYALLFGNNSYKAPIPTLDTPVGDVEKIAEVLQTNLGYDTQVVRDAGKAQIIQAINKIAMEAKPEDSVLLVYAGHGYLDEETKMGYWIPVDASVKTATGWISNNDIAKLLNAIPARQLILVSDSCFSGSLTREQKFTTGSTERLDEILNHRSVIVFSSGDEEPVSDAGKDNHSIFAWNLINRLEKVEDLTPGYEIYQVVYTDVKKDYPQSPQYGAVITAGHTAGGEYLFGKKHE